MNDMCTKKRPSWDDIWMRMASLVSERSVDPKYQVGALIVSEDNTQVLALGYNGDEKGGKNCRDSLETGESGFIHAETNALIKCDYNTSKKKRMYVTWSPCRLCARQIINANIDEVVYCKEYADTSGLEILKNAGVKIRQYSLT